MKYEYDERRQALIKLPKNKAPMIIRKSELSWNSLGPKDEMYARAIYLGQGCWEDLESVTEEKARSILTEWGYSFKDE